MRAKNKLFKSLSRELITEALLTIMDKKIYQDISIKEITDEADIARRTFYANFKEKDDVIYEYLDVLFQKFQLDIAIQNATTPAEYAYAYFKFWENNMSFLKLLYKNNLFSMLLEKYEQVLNSSKNFDANTGFNRSLVDNEKYYFNCFNAAGLWKLLSCWISNGTKETAKEMAEIYVKIMN